MTRANDNTRVIIPLTIRRRNGRPKILPPDTVMEPQSRAQDPHILRAIGRAWAWRRRLETGEASTVQDIAKAEKVTDRFVSRMMRLAYLSPDVLDLLLLQRKPSTVSLNDLTEVIHLPWAGQVAVVFIRT